MSAIAKCGHCTFSHCPMKPLHIETPLLESRALSLHAGKPVWLKMDALQPPGSFKIRGIGLACQTYQQRGAKRFIATSGGNAGIAVAYAGRQLGVPTIVVVPETATERAKALIQQQNAELIVHGASWLEANALAQSMVTDTDAFLHPFDDPLLWQGHASLIEEVVTTGVKPDIVVLSVGGGGLLSGVVEGLRRNGWGDVPVLAVETQGADSLAQAMKAKARITLPAITSVATSLGVRQVCQQAFDLSSQHRIHSAVVSDQMAVSACLKFVDHHDVVVEPACGAALAAVYQHLPVLDAFGSVLVVVCGGTTTTMEQLQMWAVEAQ
jgi:L-serine/L-threonine ammonia-lyase